MMTMLIDQCWIVRENSSIPIVRIKWLKPTSSTVFLTLEMH